MIRIRISGAAFTAAFLLFPDVAAATSAASGQGLDLGALAGGDASLSGRIVQMLALLTVLSLAPGILIMVTSFTRFVIVLSMLRTAMGLNQTPPNMVLISLALFLTAYVMTPTIDRSWQDGVRPLLDNEITEEQAVERIGQPFREFMLTHVRDKDLRLFIDLAAHGTEEPGKDSKGTDGRPATDAVTASEKAAVSWRALVPAFMLSEIRKAFEIGFLIFLPFLVIDMIVSSVLMSMGMMMLPPVMISMPFKIIFFVLIDGWWLLAGSLVRSYGVG